MQAALTHPTKASDIKRAWHLVDLKGKVLGRTACEIAKVLIGKSKPYFVRHLDCGDYVVILNAKEVKVTGRKEEKKVYYRHSGYPGGFKSETLKELRERRPEQIIIEAVKGMLPQNRLREKMLSRLFIFAGEEHKYQDKFKSQPFGFAQGENSTLRLVRQSSPQVGLGQEGKVNPPAGGQN